MTQLVFHEDETGIASLSDLSAWEYFPGHPNAAAGPLSMTGVWSPVRADKDLGALGIRLDELEHAIPADLQRIDRVFSFYGSTGAPSRLPAKAFAVDDRRAVVAELSDASCVKSIWILHSAGDPRWVKPTLVALAERWALLLIDDEHDFQFPLRDAKVLDTWLTAIGAG